MEIIAVLKEHLRVYFHARGSVRLYKAPWCFELNATMLTVTMLTLIFGRYNA